MVACVIIHITHNDTLDLLFATLHLYNLHLTMIQVYFTINLLFYFYSTYTNNYFSNSKTYHTTPNNLIQSPFIIILDLLQVFNTKLLVSLVCNQLKCSNIWTITTTCFPNFRTNKFLPLTRLFHLNQLIFYGPLNMFDTFIHIFSSIIHALLLSHDAMSPIIQLRTTKENTMMILHHPCLQIYLSNMTHKNNLKDKEETFLITQHLIDSLFHLYNNNNFIIKFTFHVIFIT